MALQRVIAALDWAGKRAGNITTSLAVYDDWLADERAREAFVDAFPYARMTRLKALDFHSLYLSESSAAGAWFTVWLGGHTPCLEVLRIRAKGLPLDHLSLCCLKHLDLCFETFIHSVPELAKHLPRLETLHLHGCHPLCSVDEIDVSRCRHLRALSLRHIAVRKLMKLPTCRLSVISRTMHHGSALEHTVSLAEYVRLHLRWQMAQDTSQGLFQSHDPLRELVLHWPLTYDQSAFSWLLRCMPANKQPLFNLKSIVIEGAIVRVIIPARLPQLKELVVASSGNLELNVEDPAATAGVLTTFHVRGRPLTVANLDVLKAAFQKRDKLLVARELPNCESSPSKYLTSGLCDRSLH